MIEKNYKKVFVNVTADMRPDGVIRPLYFRWTDGNKYENACFHPNANKNRRHRNLTYC